MTSRRTVWFAGLAAGSATSWVLSRRLLGGAVTVVVAMLMPARAATPAATGYQILDARTGATVVRLSDTRRFVTSVGSVLIDEADGDTVVRDSRGRLLWHLPIGARVLAADATDVVVQDTTPDQVLQLRATETGVDRWAGAPVYLHPAAAALDGHDLVVVGFRAGATGQAQECPELAVVDRATAAVRWFVSLRSESLAATFATVAPGDAFPPPPGLCADVAVTGVTVGARVVTLVGKNLLSFDRSTGRLLYAAASALGRAQPAPFATDPMRRSLAAAGDLAIVSSPTEVRAVDPFTRQTRWARAADQDQGPVVGSGVVIARSGTRLVVLDAATGATRWSTTVQADGEIGAGRVLLSSIRTIRALDVTKGRTVWTRSFTGSSTRASVVGATDTTVIVRVFAQRIVVDRVTTAPASSGA